MSRSTISVDQLTTHTDGLPRFGQPSYRPMIACLKAGFAEPLDTVERQHFDVLAGGRALPVEQVSELVIIAGRGSGKTEAAALVVIALALCREWRVSPGQVAVALLLAADREQASVAFRFITGLIESSPVLRAEVESVTAQRIVLRNGVEIQVATSDFRAVRGRSLIAVVADELAFWPTGPDSVSPDSEVLTAVRPGLARFPGSMLVCISSAYARRGELFDYFRSFYGKDDPQVLVVKGGTRDFNATFPQDVIDAAMRRDPARAAAEYLSEFRSDIESFVLREVIEQAMRTSPLELPFQRGVTYGAFTDPSGGGADSFTLAIGHREKERVIIDVLRERKGQPATIVAEYASALKSYRVLRVRGDKYAGEWPAQEFKRHGITYEAAGKPKSDLYVDALALLNSGRAELPPDQVLLHQFVGLERRTSRAGKDSIDHAPGGHDDRANCVAGFIATNGAISTYTLDNVRGPGDPVRLPPWVRPSSLYR